jgi:hypothetical protein
MASTWSWATCSRIPDSSRVLRAPEVGTAASVRSQMTSMSSGLLKAIGLVIRTRLLTWAAHPDWPIHLNSNRVVSPWQGRGASRTGRAGRCCSPSPSGYQWPCTGSTPECAGVSLFRTPRGGARMAQPTYQSTGRTDVTSRCLPALANGRFTDDFWDHDRRMDLT